eukprot:TRINITY_DN27813_c0_g1_i1.p1 TRINITY_DN27813_c0_g1~~TRINITY_DN27813_c0_g1_i1.p1  ORF type:complete len:302 (+),score=63.31 TRINITY_DN27813_c0_g1_i1:81-986(+)
MFGEQTLGGAPQPAGALLSGDPSREKERSDSKQSMPRQQFRKTQMCRFFEGFGCRKGDTCQFAHGKDELEDAPDLRRTSLCKAWLRGSCPNSGRTCRFAHGTWLLRRMPDNVETSQDVEDDSQTQAVQKQLEILRRQEEEKEYLMMKIDEKCRNLAQLQKAMRARAPTGTKAMDFADVEDIYAHQASSLAVGLTSVADLPEHWDTHGHSKEIQTQLEILKQQEEQKQLSKMIAEKQRSLELLQESRTGQTSQVKQPGQAYHHQMGFDALSLPKNEESDLDVFHQFSFAQTYPLRLQLPNTL